MTTTTVEQRETTVLRNDLTDDTHYYEVAKVLTHGPGDTAVDLHIRGHAVSVCGSVPDQDGGFAASTAHTWLGLSSIESDVAPAALVQGF